MRSPTLFLFALLSPLQQYSRCCVAFRTVRCLTTTHHQRPRTKLGATGSTQRLERIISNRGVGSRNDVAKLFKAGRVSIDGKVIKSGAEKYPIDVTVEIDGECVTGVPLLAVYYKPLGVHSTMKDNWNRQSLEELSLEYPYLKSMHPVGRLDADTTGLLLFSSDGQLTQMLLHPQTGIEREYEAVVAGKVDPVRLGETLSSGVTTTEGTFVADLLGSKLLDGMALVPSQRDLDDDDDDDDDEDKGRRTTVSSPSKSTSPTLKKADDVLDSSSSSSAGDMVPTSQVRVSVREGKYRMVRRILHNAGHSVLQLHRVRYGDILLQVPLSPPLSLASCSISSLEILLTNIFFNRHRHRHHDHRHHRRDQRRRWMKEMYDHAVTKRRNGPKPLSKATRKQKPIRNLLLNRHHKQMIM